MPLMRISLVACVAFVLSCFVILGTLTAFFVFAHGEEKNMAFVAFIYRQVFGATIVVPTFSWNLSLVLDLPDASEVMAIFETVPPLELLDSSAVFGAINFLFALLKPVTSYGAMAYDVISKLVGCYDEVKGTEAPRTLDMTSLSAGVRALVAHAGGKIVDEDVCDLLGIVTDVGKAKLIVEANEKEGVFQSLCGLRKGEIEADLSGKEMGPGGALLLAWDLKNGHVNRSLTSLK